MSRQNHPKTPLSYRDSGVDIDAGNALIERIKPAVKRTRRSGVIGDIGGFGALFALPLGRYNKPVLVSATDGVGTKLKLASQLQRHDTIGIDLVAMCVNDIVVCGAEPLYFLDYFATGKLNLEQAEAVITGIAEGCCQAGCALIGGETAEMPGMYQAGDYDLAGFAVGIIEKDRMQSPNNVKPGDVLLGLASSGPHSNGYALIRKIVARRNHNLDQPISLPGETSDTLLADALLAPTRIYVKSILNLLQSLSLSAISHITGGGLTANLPRVLPPGTAAEIELGSWSLPGVFQWLQASGNIEQQEMLRTFNCGIGMIVAIAAEDADNAIDNLTQSGETVFRIGKIVASTQSPAVNYLS